MPKLPSIEIESPTIFMEICGKRIRWVEQLNEKLLPGKALFMKTPLLRTVTASKFKDGVQLPATYILCQKAVFSELSHYSQFSKTKHDPDQERESEQETMLGRRKTKLKSIAIK
mgnify:FL=1